MKEKEKIIKSISYTIIIVLFIAILYILLKEKNIFYNFKPANLKSLILSYGEYSAAAFVLIYTIKPVLLVFPTSLLSIMAGHIYGPYMALALNMICCFTSATTAFLLSRNLGKSFVDRHLKGKAIKLNGSIEKHGFKVMFLMRLSVVFPYDALSFASGLSRIKYIDFILGTEMGVLPEMTAYSFAGSNIGSPLSLKFMLPAAAAVVIAIWAYFYNKKQKI